MKDAKSSICPTNQAMFSSFAKHIVVKLATLDWPYTFTPNLSYCQQPCMAILATCPRLQQMTCTLYCHFKAQAHILPKMGTREFAMFWINQRYDIHHLTQAHTHTHPPYPNKHTHVSTSFAHTQSLIANSHTWPYSQLAHD